MTDTALIAKLDTLANRLVPVAGTLMQVACSNGRCARKPDIHEPDCECQICRAFVAVQSVMSGLEEIIRSLKEAKGTLS